MDHIKELKKDLQEVQERLHKLPSDREAVQQRLDAAKRKHTQVESQITELRKERQTMLANEEDSENVNARLKEVRKSDELLEDEIEGLSARILSFDKEAQKLAAEEISIKKAIFKEEIIRPLVEKYNEEAVGIAGILTGIDGAVQTYIKTFSSQGRTLIQSDTDGGYYGIRSLPAIWMYNEEPLPDHYNRLAVMAKLADEERERRQKDRYPNAPCFRCERYFGVYFDNTVRCTSLGGEVPQEILLGQRALRSPESERCRFHSIEQIKEKDLGRAAQ